jgi:hypothetical protein
MESEANVGHIDPVRSKRGRLGLCIPGTLCAILLIWVTPYLKAVPLLWAKPTIKVDYLAECNRVSKPEGYDPNKNAEPYYEKLFAEFRPLPPVLADMWQGWPKNLSSAEAKALRAWMSVNESALVHLTAAASQPYWWYELKSGTKALCDIQVPYLAERRKCAWGVVLLAKAKANRGDPDGAIRLLLDLHQMGIHGAMGTTLVDQLVGVAICRLSMDAALEVLNRCRVSARTLGNALESLGTRPLTLEIPRFSQVEQLSGYDWMQRLFTDDGRGNGRLIPGLFAESTKGEGRSLPSRTLCESIFICAWHVDRRKTAEDFDYYFAEARRIARETPWHLHTQSASYKQSIWALANGNYFLAERMRGIDKAVEMGWHATADARGFLTVVAVLTYKARKGHLPQSLDELVASGLMKQVPMDPFSDQPLIYKPTGNTFTLYSVGENFEDDGGQPGEWRQDPPVGDHVFWPVRPSR